jgi:protein-arginine kinase activator protein McsA
MEFCALCEKPCISDNHYKVVDVKGNKMEKESVFCQGCGLTYIQAVFRKPEPPPKPAKQKADLSGYNIKIINTPEELLSTMMGMGIVKKAPEKPKTQYPCPACGLDHEAFIAKGRFGCARCYTQFQETYLAMADTFQSGARKHVGKRPRNYTDQSEKGDLKTLKLRMASAVEREKYEEAALIRDQIKALEEKNRVDLKENEQGSQ